MQKTYTVTIYTPTTSHARRVTRSDGSVAVMKSPSTQRYPQGGVVTAHSVDEARQAVHALLVDMRLSPMSINFSARGEQIIVYAKEPA